MESHGQSGAPIDKFYIDRNTSYSVQINPNPFGICTEHLEQGLVTHKQILVRRIGTRVLIPLSELQRFSRSDHPERLVGYQARAAVCARGHGGSYPPHWG